MKTIILSLLVLTTWAVSSHAALDLHTQPMQDLKGRYRDGLAALDTRHAERLKALVDRFRADMDKLLAEKKATRNISGMAIARAGIRIAEGWDGDLEAKRDVKRPDRVRRELTVQVDAAMKDKAALDLARETEAAELRVTLATAFTTLAEAQGADLSGVDAAFEALLASEDRIRQDEATAAEGGEPAGTLPPGVAATSEVLATSAEGEGWYTFAKWYAAMPGMHVLEFPVTGRAKMASETDIHPMTGDEFKMLYVPTVAIEPRDGLLFRIKSIRGRQPAEVLTWPSHRNNWALELRLRPQGELPAEHGIELQVGGPAAAEFR